MHKKKEKRPLFEVYAGSAAAATLHAAKFSEASALHRASLALSAWLQQRIGGDEAKLTSTRRNIERQT